MTFEDLVKLEPRLKDLLNEAKVEGKRSGGYHTSFWYHDMKPRIEALVGFLANTENSVLGSSEAHEIVYRTILEALEGE